MSNFIITIARGLGSGGSHIARKLSETLSIPCYDEEILRMASDYSGISEKYFFEANEKINKGQIAVNSSKGVFNSTLYGIGDKRYLSNENMFNYQAVIIKELALEGKESCIIIGKAANHIIGSLHNVIKINIQAPFDYCIGNIVKRKHISRKEAEKMIITTDRYRQNYYKYYTGRNWTDPKEYDISINTGEIDEDYAVNMIIGILRYKGFLQESL